MAKVGSPCCRPPSVIALQHMPHDSVVTNQPCSTKLARALPAVCTSPTLCGLVQRAALHLLPFTNIPTGNTHPHTNTLEHTHSTLITAMLTLQLL